MIRRMITTVEADEIAGAGGRPALRVQIGLACGIRESAVICPSGKRQGESGGAYLKRCHELVQEAVKATETLVREYLTGSPAQEQEALEARLKPLLSECTDETGAALRFAVSAAAAKAAAHAFSVPLYRYLGGVCAAAPVPLFDMISMPETEMTGLKRLVLLPKKQEETEMHLRQAVRIYQQLGELLREGGKQTVSGPEGGYAPSVRAGEEAVEYVLRAVEEAGYRVGDEFELIVSGTSEWTGRARKLYPVALSIEPGRDGFLQVWPGEPEGIAQLLGRLKTDAGGKEGTVADPFRFELETELFADAAAAGGASLFFCGGFGADACIRSGNRLVQIAKECAAIRGS